MRDEQNNQPATVEITLATSQERGWPFPLTCTSSTSTTSLTSLRNHSQTTEGSPTIRFLPTGLRQADSRSLFGWMGNWQASLSSKRARTSPQNLKSGTWPTSLLCAACAAEALAKGSRRIFGGNFPGTVGIRVITTNVPAQQFWAKAISRFLGKAIEPELVTKGEETRYLFLFESEANPTSSL